MIDIYQKALESWKTVTQGHDPPGLGCPALMSWSGGLRPHWPAEGPFPALVPSRTRQGETLGGLKGTTVENHGWIHIIARHFRLIRICFSMIFSSKNVSYGWGLLTFRHTNATVLAPFETTSHICWVHITRWWLKSQCLQVRHEFIAHIVQRFVWRDNP